MTVTGVIDNPYAFPNFKVEATNVDAGVPIMVWRSVGNSHTEFARESALDELPVAVGRDAVDLRRDLLVNNPRTLRALELAAERARWGSPPGEGRARGIACTNYLSHSAQVVEISQDDRKRIHVERIVFALDCGIVVDPDLVRAQVESGLLWAGRRRLGRDCSRCQWHHRDSELRSLPGDAHAVNSVDRSALD